MSKITIDRAVVEQAMKAMLNFPGDISDEMFESIRALRAALAEPAKEPAFHGFMSDDGTQVDVCFSPSAPRRDGTYATAYYTAPPQRDALLQALQTLMHVCQRMDLEHQAERPSEAEYQAAMQAAQAAIQAVEGAA